MSHLCHALLHRTKLTSAAILFIGYFVENKQHRGKPIVRDNIGNIVDLIRSAIGQFKLQITTTVTRRDTCFF